ncbi:cytochrome c3 family protein [Shewanella intestini]|uniref:Cytochrome c3 family protein n=1 Tax=Shewanella intestini TaxID=2017544 RepID=A0ABS5I1A3_9GAMM|nr:cytochrome c3 family protein [Shewanella sp. XMDDZSB0408]MBR9727180.1 cytochrome c3 family protein [Shewanella intestini]MRG35982.1 cytochrome C [Shewanella sp. XMDDZSB0408]
MSNKLLTALFAAGFALLSSTASFAADEKQNLADFHVEMGGCENCHADGEPSADGAYEFEQCQSCHGALSEMDKVHQSHDGKLMCADCHAPHDTNVGDRPECSSCHDDGRTADKINKQ